MLSHPNRIRVSIDCGTELITKQSHKSECDINNIVSQYKRTGVFTHTSQYQPIYTDLPDNLDYQSSLEIIQQSEGAFATLPSIVRSYFENDPSLLLTALSDPNQTSKLIEFGILANPNLVPQPPGNPPAPTPGEVLRQPSLLPALMDGAAAVAANKPPGS